MTPTKRSIQRQRQCRDTQAEENLVVAAALREQGRARPCRAAGRHGDRLLGGRRDAGRTPARRDRVPATAMVDAALAGLDQDEFATVPSLPNLADWNAYEAARQALIPNLSAPNRPRASACAANLRELPSSVRGVSRNGLFG
jgi:hypothetical protein